MSELRMVSNTNQGHLKELQNLLDAEVDRLIIASPFLASNITEFLNDLSFKKVKSLELITTLKPKDSEQLTKPFILKELFEYFANNYPNMKLQIHVDNYLHGKVYIAKTPSSQTMIVSSANFTRNGLSHNHEWGLVTNDNEIINNLIVDLFNSTEYQDVTFTQVKKACLFAEQYAKDYPEWKIKPDIFCDILESIYSAEDRSNINPQYFLKPVGVTESPILLEDEHDFSSIFTLFKK
jgi:HKD family nuclease